MVKQQKNIITLHSVCTGLGLKQTQLNEIIDFLRLVKVKNSRGRWALEFTDYEIVRDYWDKDKKNPGVKSIPNIDPATVRKELLNHVSVTTHPRPEGSLKKSISFVGPTNSGKTYHGLQLLFEDYENSDGVCVYCGPLRLLAYEVYLKMVERYGEQNVGFITGETQINPTARLLATTAEMAPREGHSLLVDEAHWLTDPDRGSVWTRLLYSSVYDNIYSLTAAEALPLVKSLTKTAKIQEERLFVRKTPVSFSGVIPLTKIPKKTAVVCFSRKHVYQVASELIHAGYKPGVLYGNLPLQVRTTEIEKYLAGKYDVMVVTDVIGHGINLPIDNVVFTETQKFDGNINGPLHLWEGAQIAGRAGRYGLSEKGKVFLATGASWFSLERNDVKDYTSGAMGTIPTDLIADEAYFEPSYTDLGVTVHGEEATKYLLAAVEVWEEKGLKDQGGRLYPSLLREVKTNLIQIYTALKMSPYPWESVDTRTYPLSTTKDLWSLATGPYESSLPTLSATARWLTSPDREKNNELFKVFTLNVQTPLQLSRIKAKKDLPSLIVSLENAALIIGELKMVMVMFGVEKYGTKWLGELSEEHLNEAHTEIVKYISSKLQENIRRTPPLSKKKKETN